MNLLEDRGIATSVKGVKISLNEETLGIIPSVPTVGVKTTEGCKPSTTFTEQASKKGEPKKAGVPKKYIK